MADRTVAGLSIRPIREDERTGLAELVRSNWGSPVVEFVLLDALERRHGIGTALLEAVIEIARKSNSTRLWLVTTNDNLDALRFYQRRGLHLAHVWADATTRAREIKPEIPLIGDFGIAIRDELELEVVLRPDAIQSPAGNPDPERGASRTGASRPGEA